jgi:hypothetical protein
MEQPSDDKVENPELLLDLLCERHERLRYVAASSSFETTR